MDTAVSPTLSRTQQNQLVRLGALARIRELEEEERQIVAAFPDLGRTTTGTRQSGRRGMSPAARKAVSIRMKRYWAARRRAKK